MSTRMFKFFSLQIVLILSLLLSACDDGDRDFVPLPDPEVEEEPLPIVIKAAGVKGPLVNAEVGLYKLDLDSGLIKQYGDASEAFFRLLTEANVVINTDGSISANNETTPAEALAFIQEHINEIGYVTELPRLQNIIKDSVSVDEAILALEKYLDDESLEGETNTIPKADVQKIFEGFATLTELKSKISNLQPFITQLSELTSISSAQSLMSKFHTSETDSFKKKGWTAIRKTFGNTTTSLSSVRSDLSDRVLELSEGNKLEEDHVALNRLNELEENVNSAATLAIAESLITQAITEEGNVIVRQSLSALKTSIISFDDFISQAQMDNALYHFSSLKTDILGSESNPVISLNGMYNAVFDTLSTELEPSLADAFKNEELDIFDEPANQIIKSLSGDTSLLEGINLGDYSGFVYMEVESINNTIDLNSGTKPIISKLNTIFHTDEIRGYGNNSNENRTLYYLKNGQEQRDSEGVLITNESDIEKSSSDVVLEVQPYRFATPLTKLAVSVIIERFKKIGPQLTDTNGDGELEYRITNSALKSELALASKNIISAFGLEDAEEPSVLEEHSIYESSAFLTLPMQYSDTEQEAAIQYRAMIESFSGFITALTRETNFNTDYTFSLVVKDFLDEEMDGYEFSSEIEIDVLNSDEKIKLNDVSDIAYLVTRSPADVYIPGTNKTIDEISGLMSSQLNTIEPEFPVQSLFSDDPSFINPLGGVDSDGDEYLNNSDAFPNDATKHITLDENYSGVWALIVAKSNRIVPFSGEFTYSITRTEQSIETSLPTCASVKESCLFEGSTGSDFTATWEVIRGPEGGNLQISDTFARDDAIGFNAIGNVSGVYQVRLKLETEEEPVQTYSKTIAVEIMNPQDLEIQFNPEEPLAGKAVKVEFQATDDICEAYEFCDENHLNQYFDITHLPELKASWSLNGGETKQYRSFVLDPDSDSVEYFNSSNGDTLNIDVVYSSGSEEIGFVEFIAEEFSKVIGLKADSDNDNITDDIDAFPTNSACSREADGFINELGVEVCNSQFINSETTSNTTTLNISFSNEAWLYDNDWGMIFRTYTDEEGETRFHDSITLPIEGLVNKVVSKTLVDEEARRVYLAYTDGEIDYFSFDDHQLHDFVDSNNNIPVELILPVGLAVLVEYKEGANPSEFQLYQRSGELSVIKAKSKYPKPGVVVELEIDGEAILEFANTFKPEWSLTRLVNDQPTDIDITASDDALTLLSGQTTYGDILTVSFVGTDGIVVKEVTIAVLDTLDFRLEKSTYRTTDILTMLAGTYDLNSADAKEFIKVKWLKYNASTDSNNFQSLDIAFPFSYSASNAVNGDIVTAEIYLKSGADTNLLLETEFALILPSEPSISFAFEFAENPTFDAADKEAFKVEISEPTVSDKYFADHFTPVWLLDGEVVEGENSLTFPTNADTNIKFGSTLSVFFEYVIGSEAGITPEVSVITFDIDLQSTKYNLFPTYPVPGDDITIDYEDFKEDSLAGYFPKWFINGKLDEGVETLTYPGDNLKFGDHVELILEETDIDKEDDIEPLAFTHTAEIYVGVNVLNSTLDDGVDSDGDTVLNKNDFFRYDPACFAESDGNPDDIDGDGLSDLNELFPDNTDNRSIPNAVDTDQDGLSDLEELLAGTNPNNADTDGDSFLDGLEVNKLSTNPLDDAQPGNSDDDLDRDGILNEDELALGTFVNNTDSDNDGLLDGMELTKGTDPLNPDSDGDGLSDGLEVYITKTDPIGVVGNLDGTDSDGDGLSDGVEVRLLNFNPNDVDTNDDGILDALENSAVNVGALPVNDYLNMNDLNDYAFGEASSMVPAGTCYSTWLGQQELDQVVVSHEPQLDGNSKQQLLFAKYEWPEILRYDAKNLAFLPPLTEQLIKGNISAIEYDVADLDIQYFGYLNGQVRQYNASTKELKDLFYVGEPLRIEHIIDQGEYLLVETTNGTISSYKHYLVDKNVEDPVNTIPVTSEPSVVSYKNSIWVDKASRTELLFLTDEPVEIILGDVPVQRRLIKETINVDTPSISQSAQIETVDSALKAPIFIELLDNEKALNFASGQVLNLTTNTWLVDAAEPPQEITIPSFELGLQHDSVRITVPTNTSQILRNYQSTLREESLWISTQQSENDQILSLVPVGIDTLVISHRTNGISQLYNQPPLAFELTSGDFDSDGLSDRLEFDLCIDEFDEFDFCTNIGNVGNKDTDGDGLTDSQEVLLTLTNPFDNDSNDNGILDGDEDSDGDGLSNAVELNETDTLINSTNNDDQNSDFDNDGLSNFIEVTQTLTNPSIKDSDSNGIEDGDEDFDQDGLSNLQELNNTLTSLIDSDDDDNGTKDGDEDGDGDGLSDGLELNNINPETDEPFYDFELADSDSNDVDDGDEDFDGDALSNRVEIEVTKTDPWLADTDGNGINDGAEDRDSDGLTDRQEIVITGTEFTNPDTDGDLINDGDEDTDGDGLKDWQELQFSSVAHLTSDSDNDGISDYDEVSVYGTNPMLKDTDGDGIDDNEEIDLDNSILISDPTSPDGDMDGLSDQLELGKVTDPLYPDFLSNPLLSDSDGDGLSDAEEFEFEFVYSDEELIEFGLTNPNTKMDPNKVHSDCVVDPEDLDGVCLNNNDGDGLSDAEESILGTNPGMSDTDNDGLSDSEELHATHGFKTNPIDIDTDGDGLKDGDEVLISLTNPLDEDSNDNGILDGDEDSDQDGLSDAVELNRTLTDIHKKDTDDNGIEDGLEDPDGDNLTNFEEIEKQTDPHNVDTDEDGVTDDQETSKETALNPDADGDGLTDGEELNPVPTPSNPDPVPTDPNNADTDGDGLSDFDERVFGSNPHDKDTDHDFLLDGEDADVGVLNWDSDFDGIPDGIEQHYLNSSPTTNDTDKDGLEDGQEVWIYALNDGELIQDGELITDEQLISVGIEFEVKLNSHFGDPGFDPTAFASNNKDRQVLDVSRVISDKTGIEPDQIENATLYIRSISRPDEDDTDGDGLTDFTELMQIESIGEKGYDPMKLNSENFKISDPWVLDTPDEDGVINGINDGDEDFDGDFYSNLFEQTDKDTDILNPHSDRLSDDDPSDIGDGILDGLEVLLLSSKPDLIDTDEDGLNDNEELAGAIDPTLETGPLTCRIENTDPSVNCLNAPDELVITDNACLETEVILPNIAGVTYCFTINFDSLPTLTDSDNDGVLDPADDFALDSSCSTAADGFTDSNTNKKQCFSSWMAQQGEIEQIGHVQWVDNAPENQSQIAFFSEGWDKVVRFDTLEASYLPLVVVDTDENAPALVKIDYSSQSRRLYLAYDDGLITYIDLVLPVAEDEVPIEVMLIADASDLNATLDTIVVAGTSVIVQLKGATEYTHKIFNEAGQQAVANLSGSEDFNLEKAFWDQSTSRLYGFKQAVGQTISNLGYVNIDEINNQFNGGIVYSPSLAAETNLSGPIALSQDGASVYLGSGQKRLAALGAGDDIEPELQKTYQSTVFSSFRELIELGDHFVAVVDINAGSNSVNPPIRNGIFIEDITDLSASNVVNNRYLSQVDDNEQVLKLVPFLNGGDPELAFVSNDSNRVTIDYLGLQDEDGDGMSGIYEAFYGLDDTNADDRFTDPDDDLLTNIEEFNSATDPLKADTDGDSWDDAYEIINSTDPLNAADF